jgi:tetratricopeptide (TPR) repeat protein
VAVFWLRIFASGHQDQYYVMGTNIFPMLGWATAAVCAACSCRQGLRHVVPILGLGLAAFLVSDLISFALFVPGSATTFWAVAGLCLAARRGADSTQKPDHGAGHHGAPPAGLVVLATAIACAAIYLFAIVPVARSWPLLNAAREMARRGQAQAAEMYLAAHRADPLDPTSLAELTALESPQIPAEELVRLLVQLDPENPSTYRRLAAMELRLGTLQGAQAAAAHYDDVLRRYPSSPKDWLRASQIQSRIHELGGDDHSLRRALEYLERALALDGRRDPNEIRRFTPLELDALHKTRDDLLRQLP